VPAVGVDLKRANVNLKVISSSTPISHNFPGIAGSAREKAQDQYRRALKKALGSPDLAALTMCCRSTVHGAMSSRAKVMS
jgi:hypothetical protein